MEQLNHLIKDFECHNFQTSLELYSRCIARAEEENMPKYIIFNLKSSQAALFTIVGELEKAEESLNEVLKQESQHFLCLLRRSQVYKKQAKYKKALKDLDVIAMFAPDNMQVSALKLEIKGLMKKPNQDSSSDSESESDIQKIDEEEVLQFSNLKKIERTSVSIMLPKDRRSRQSRVTITGDKSYFYEANDDEDEKQQRRQSIVYTPSFNCKRYIQIQQELQKQKQEKQVELPPVIIKAKANRSKSILKNRDSTIFKVDRVAPETNQQQKKLIEKVQNIDGHSIGADFHSSTKVGSEKQVQFKKSLYQKEQQQETESQPVKFQVKSKPKSSGRKSCLKRSSFSLKEEQVDVKKGPRRSKFDSMTRNSIDGKLIKSDKKRKQQEHQSSKQNHTVSNSESQIDGSEEGSQYNIFGSNKIDINKELRQNLGLGLGSDSVVEQSITKEPKKKVRNQSILKTTSIVVKKEPKKKVSIFFKAQSEQEQNVQKKPQRKAKKSVMFTS